MTPTETVYLIRRAGGDSAFAKLIGINFLPGFQQRVNNWKRRGMPAGVVLDHYDAIQKLKNAEAA